MEAGENQERIQAEIPGEEKMNEEEVSQELTNDEEEVMAAQAPKKR